MENYESLGVLGEGTYGVVVKAQNKSTGQLVAIKKFKQVENEEHVKKTSMREVRMLKQLKHPNIINLMEVFRRDGQLFLVFEYVERTILECLESTARGLPPKELKRYMYQLLRAVEYCHDNSVIHRDVKPENILISAKGVLKLCDFGFARPITTKGKYTDYVATRWYRAPELLVGDVSYTKAVDIWAIGCIFAELSDTQPLFPGSSDLDQLSMILRCCGPLPSKMIRIFEANPLYKRVSFPRLPLQRTIYDRYASRPQEWLEFLSSCLATDPEKRLSCTDLLNLDYFTKNNFREEYEKELQSLGIFAPPPLNPKLHKRGSKVASKGTGAASKPPVPPKRLSTGRKNSVTLPESTPNSTPEQEIRPSAGTNEHSTPSGSHTTDVLSSEIVSSSPKTCAAKTEELHPCASQLPPSLSTMESEQSGALLGRFTTTDTSDTTPSPMTDSDVATPQEVVAGSSSALHSKKCESEANAPDGRPLEKKKRKDAELVAGSSTRHHHHHHSDHTKVTTQGSHAGQPPLPLIYQMGSEGLFQGPPAPEKRSDDLVTFSSHLGSITEATSHSRRGSLRGTLLEHRRSLKGTAFPQIGLLWRSQPSKEGSSGGKEDSLPPLPPHNPIPCSRAGQETPSAGQGDRSSRLSQETSTGRMNSRAGQEPSTGRMNSRLGQEPSTGRMNSQLSQEPSTGRLNSRLGEELSTGRMNSRAGQEPSTGRLNSRLGEELSTGRMNSRAGQEPSTGRLNSQLGQEPSTGRLNSQLGQEPSTGRLNSRLGEELSTGRMNSRAGQEPSTGRMNPNSTSNNDGLKETGSLSHTTAHPSSSISSVPNNTVHSIASSSFVALNKEGGQPTALATPLSSGIVLSTGNTPVRNAHSGHFPMSGCPSEATHVMPPNAPDSSMSVCGSSQNTCQSTGTGESNPPLDFKFSFRVNTDKNGDSKEPVLAQLRREYKNILNKHSPNESLNASVSNVVHSTTQGHPGLSLNSLGGTGPSNAHPHAKPNALEALSALRDHAHHLNDTMGLRSQASPPWKIRSSPVGSSVPGLFGLFPIETPEEPPQLLLSGTGTLRRGVEMSSVTSTSSLRHRRQNGGPQRVAHTHRPPPPPPKPPASPSEMTTGSRLPLPTTSFHALGSTLGGTLSGTHGGLTANFPNSGQVVSSRNPRGAAFAAGSAFLDKMQHEPESRQRHRSHDFEDSVTGGSFTMNGPKQRHNGASELAKVKVSNKRAV